MRVERIAPLDHLLEIVRVKTQRVVDTMRAVLFPHFVDELFISSHESVLSINCVFGGNVDGGPASELMRMATALCATNDLLRYRQAPVLLQLFGTKP